MSRFSTAAACALALGLVAACSDGAANDRVEDVGDFVRPELGADCGCPGGGTTCDLAACGDRAACVEGTCTITCDTSADCPQSAVCTDGPGGVRGCFWFCSDAGDCPTTTPVCTGSGFGYCEE
jgi:hypothetical protein